MAVILDALVRVLQKPTLLDVLVELVPLAAPLWIAVFLGLLVGWAWRPRWAAWLVRRENVRLRASSNSNGSSREVVFAEEEESAEGNPASRCKELAVTGEDLGHLCRLVEVKDGGPAWIKMMEKSLPNMRYQAWRRDPETGPPQYRSSTIFEDATPEVVRDFFWDDEFRMKNGWDDMLLHHETLEECLTSGTMVVQWIRKFPFFCSNREYIIGRRIWHTGSTYYCVTKGVPRPSVPRRNKPRRVDLYYSSWCIRAVESSRGDNQMTACEVLLFHHEDMGIPWEIAKLGVRQGMWGCVKRIEPGLRAYQIARTSDEPVSRCASMAQINTKFSVNDLRSMEDLITMETDTSSSTDIVEAEKPKHWAGSIPKYMVVGGAVALACTLDHGLLTKAVIFGVARRFAKLGK